MSKRYIQRVIYENKVMPFLDKSLIKIFVGQRRVGKSYVLIQTRDLLLKNIKGIVSKDIIFINKELYEFDKIRDYHDLLAYINGKSKDKRKKYVFIDEIQDISGFEIALRDLQAKENFDIYCSGSNSKLLSSELATYLSGRYIEIEVFPLSYREFLLFHNLTNSKEVFMNYIQFGSLPYLIHLELKEEIINDYLRNVYNSILLKDVVERYAIRNVNFLERLVFFLSDNVGSLLSAKKISDFLKSQNINISTNVVLNYLDYLASVLLINKTSRIEVKGKKVFEVGEKYYFTDFGIRNSLIGYRQIDISKALENIVFMQLQVFGYKVYVGKLESKEIDFVCEKNGIRKYIQVSYLLSDEKTVEREFNNLLAIKDNYEKYVLSMDDFIAGDFKGIKQMNIMDFLLLDEF